MVDSENTAERGTPRRLPASPRSTSAPTASGWSWPKCSLPAATACSTKSARTPGSPPRWWRPASSSRAAVEATITALRHFLSIATGYGVGRISAIATSAVRDAENGPEFCQRVRSELDLDVEVISSDEEARLAFLSVQRAFDISGREVAVADIGGGSTEIILASSGWSIRFTRRRSVRSASPRSATRPASRRPKQLEKLRKYVDRVLKQEVGKPPFVPSMFYGTGGTFTALASMIMAREGQAGQPMWGFRVTGAQIRHLVTDLAQLHARKAQARSPASTRPAPTSSCPGW